MSDLVVITALISFISNLSLSKYHVNFVNLNDYLPYIGMIFTLIAWRCERFNTKPIAINIAMIGYIFVWLSLYLTDYNPLFHPTFGSVLARTIFIGIELLVILYVHSVTAKMKAYRNEINFLKGIVQNDRKRIVSVNPQ